MRFLILFLTLIFAATLTYAQPANCRNWQQLFDTILTAAPKAQAEAIRQCAAKGTKWSTKDKYGFTALSASLSFGDLTVFETLLDIGVSPNLTDRTGETAAHLIGVSTYPLSIKQRVKALKLLAKHDADFEKLDKYKQTPLMVAASFDEVEAVKALLDLGASPTTLSPSGRNALFGTVQGTCAHRSGTLLLKAGLRADQMTPKMQKLLGVGLFHCAGSTAEKAYAERLRQTMSQ